MNRSEDYSDGHAPSWVCPWCGNDETWFDRQIIVSHSGETIEGMKDRCTNCGRADDDLPKLEQRQVGLISRIIAALKMKLP